MRMIKRERLKYISPIFIYKGADMISFYEIDDDYIEYLRKFDKKVSPHTRDFSHELGDTI